MKRICVFCGANPGARAEYVAAAAELGRRLAREGIALVYGGGRLGLMGDMARAALEAGGTVIGVVPENLFTMEQVFHDLADLRVVASMHERKALMAELADAFITLPGGLGTLEEMFEAVAHHQIGLHAKPCGLLNVCGYYDRLIAFLDHSVDELFVAAAHREAMLVDDDPARLIRRLTEWTASPPQRTARE